MTTDRPHSTKARTGVGLLLLLPALIALLVGYVWPSISTFQISLTRGDLIGDDDKFVGLDNYGNVGGDLVGAVIRVLPYLVLPLLALLIVAPLLGVAAGLAGKAGRWTVRLALTLPIVCFTPAGMATLWRLAYDPDDWSPGLPVGLTTFGLVCGVGVTVALAVFRRSGMNLGTLFAGLAVAGLGVLTTLALVLQVYTFPALTGFRRRGESIPLELVAAGFQYARLGESGAAASLLGLLLGVLGLLAAAVIIGTGLRVEFDPVKPAGSGETRPAGRRTIRLVAAAVAAVLLLIVLGVTLFGLRSWLWPKYGSGSGDLSLGRVLVNTWIPSLISTVVGVALAAAAGYAIGVLRPLGRFSPLLLLPFAPWLFVGQGPLMIANYDDAGELGVGDSFLGLIPPGWLAIPALFVFTAFFIGQARQRAAAGADAPSTARTPFSAWRRALPLVALVVGATWLVRSQDVLWSMIAGTRKEYLTGPQAAVRGIQTLSIDATRYALPFIAVILFAIALGVLQVLYLDRLAIRVGGPFARAAAPPATPAPQTPQTPQTQQTQQTQPAPQAQPAPPVPPATPPPSPPPAPD